jgi:hypothetical protein
LSHFNLIITPVVVIIIAAIIILSLQQGVPVDIASLGTILQDF